MNKNRLEGNWEQFKGDVKRKWARLTDDDLKEVEGNYDKLKGKLQERYGDRKREIQEEFDSWIDQL